MRRPFTYISAALMFCVLMLTFSLPSTTRTVKAGDLQERCDRCTIKNAERYDKCLATKPLEDQQQCHDEYNEGVVHCYKNFCEQ